jgi:peptidoglycan/LPS O-acetylase OafA/YrhL
MNDWKLRDELLSLETFSPNLREEYQKELKNMLEKRLRPWQRVWWGWWALLGFGFMVGFGALALLTGPDLAWPGRIIFGFGSLFGAVWMIVCLGIVKKGTLHLRKDPFVLGGITWTFLVVVSVVALVVGGQTEDTAKGVLMIVSILVFLVMSGLMLTWGRIADSELRFRENFLRLELQLSELAEHARGEKDK